MRLNPHFFDTAIEAPLSLSIAKNGSTLFSNENFLVTSNASVA